MTVPLKVPAQRSSIKAKVSFRISIRWIPITGREQVRVRVRDRAMNRDRVSIEIRRVEIWRNEKEPKDNK